MGDMLRKAVHMKDMSWIPAPEPEEPVRATNLPEDAEDALRKAMFDLFDL